MRFLVNILSWESLLIQKAITGNYVNISEVATLLAFRGSVMSGTDLTSYSALNLSNFQANKRAQLQAELTERA